MLHALRRIERPLVVINALGSLVFGWLHETVWLVVPLLTFGGYLLAEERILRLRLGGPAWTSEGYTRFVVGSNLSLMTRNLMLDALLFTFAALFSGTIIG